MAPTVEPPMSWVAVFASLASKSLEERTEAERLLLLEACDALVKSGDLPIHPWRRGRPGSRLTVEDPPTHRELLGALTEMQGEVRRVLSDIVDHDRLALPKLGSPSLVTLKDDGDGGTMVFENVTAMLTVIFTTLILRPDPPFARCPQCRDVFEQSQNRKYCTLRCASRAVEDGRRLKKNAYMREYLREYRKGKRRSAGSQKRSDDPQT